jgi:hypothetical protein
MNSIMFYTVSEYSDHASKLRLTLDNKNIQQEIWDSSNDAIKPRIDKYISSKKALREYKIRIAEAILGGWKILSIFPKREYPNTDL